MPRVEVTITLQGRPAAWETARTTTAVSLLPTEQVQHFSRTYGQLGLKEDSRAALDGLNLAPEPSLL